MLRRERAEWLRCLGPQRLDEHRARCGRAQPNNVVEPQEYPAALRALTHSR